MHPVRFPALVAVALWSLASPVLAEVNVVVEHNTGAAATKSFTFQKVPAPSKSDAASQARVVLAQGLADSNSGRLATLNDGLSPLMENEPKANFFFSDQTLGGCFRIDLGRAVEIAQVNSFSWHVEKRGPQVYKLYASASSDANPKVTRGSGDPVAAGWKLVASVDTRANQKTTGGQYGVQITDTSGSLGAYRHLLFCSEAALIDDPDSNTFYSEVDVVEKKVEKK